MSSNFSARPWGSLPRSLALATALVLSLGSALAAAAQIDVQGPQGSHSFGSSVTTLPNGNIVVTDPSAGDDFAGAVYLYSPTGTLISTLRGSTKGDSVGRNPIIVLPDGNFLVASRDWTHDGAARAGAVTWVSGTTGLDGVVSADNSLVGTSTDDQVGSNVVVLANGNYVVGSENWTRDGAARAGAATLVPADGSLHGAVSAANSLVGTTASDFVGATIVPLTNGNYLVATPTWNNGAIVAAGAVTWANGATGITGPVSAQNSLVGAATFDRVGSETEWYYLSVWPLPDGNAVVVSPDWDNGTLVDAGAATWIDGTVGLTGTLSAANSLVGTTAGDQLGAGGIDVGFSALPGGRYAILSSAWSASGVEHAGAITWGDGAVGVRGPVTAENSLVGTTSQDFDLARVFALDDGNFVVGTPHWSSEDVQWVGAATWIDGSAPRVGALSTATSLVGSQQFDEVGTSVAALHGGRYVVASPSWRNGDAVSAGAATWVGSDGARTGVVSAANSLVGADAGDAVGTEVVALTNGNYLVASPNWIRDGLTQAGAVTWGSGDTGIVGVVSTENSLVGDTTRDHVGSDIIALANGNAVVASLAWHDLLGAVTWIDGTTGRSGTVSSANSLVSSVEFERLGNVTALGDTGNYLVPNADWNGHLGAAAWGDGRAGLVGVVSPANALIGVSPYYDVARDVIAVGGGNALVTSDASVTLVRGTAPTIGPVSGDNSALNMFGHPARVFDYDAAHDRLVVGWSGDNYVSIFQTETLLANGFD